MFSEKWVQLKFYPLKLSLLCCNVEPYLIAIILMCCVLPRKATMSGMLSFSLVMASALKCLQTLLLRLQPFSRVFLGIQDDAMSYKYWDLVIEQFQEDTKHVNRSRGSTKGAKGTPKFWNDKNKARFEQTHYQGLYQVFMVSSDLQGFKNKTN